MRVQRTLLIGACVLLGAAAVYAGSKPVAVSPGDTSKLVLIGETCPTFSWGGVAEAKSYELVVYRVEEGSEEAKPVIRQRISGSALSWTPSLDSCLSPGGQYAWNIRAVENGRESEWSPLSIFQVAAPSEAEFEEALMVVRGYLGAAGGARSTSGSADEMEHETEAEADEETEASSPVPAAAETTQLAVFGGVVATSFTGDLTCVGCVTEAELGFSLDCPIGSFLTRVEAGLPVCGNPLSCGDGVVDAGEECDDGNNVNGDGCSAVCAIEPCGNGILDPGEECDDGNLIPGDGCRADCTIEECGDGILDPGEECDDGNNDPGDSCYPDCTVALVVTCGTGGIGKGLEWTVVHDDCCDDLIGAFGGIEGGFAKKGCPDGELWFRAESTPDLRCGIASDHVYWCPPDGSSSGAISGTDNWIRVQEWEFPLGASRVSWAQFEFDFSRCDAFVSIPLYVSRPSGSDNITLAEAVAAAAMGCPE